MIIQQVTAENILKYRSLTLKNLPQQGLIAISGANESGKTAIGETICLALFGRTFALPKSELKKAIRWGATQAKVTLGFTVAQTPYQIIRHFDAEGRQSAQLYQGETLISQDADIIEHQLYPLIGFNYTELIDSFYLAQREITLPHPQGNTVKQIIGAHQLEQVIAEIQQEIGHYQQQKETAKQHIANTNIELMELNLDESLLGRLQQQQQQQQAALQIQQQQATQLQTLLMQLQEQNKQVKQANERLLQNTLATTTYIQWQQAFTAQRQATTSLSETLQKIQTLIPINTNLLQEIHIFNQEYTRRILLFNKVIEGATQYQTELLNKLDRQQPHNLLTQKQQLQQKQALARTQKGRYQALLIILGICLVSLLISAGLLQWGPIDGPWQGLKLYLDHWGTAIGIPVPAASWLWGGSLILVLLHFIIGNWTLDNKACLLDLEAQVQENATAIMAAEQEKMVCRDLDTKPLATIINQLTETTTDTLIKLAKFFNTSGGAVFVNPAALADFQTQIQTVSKQEEEQAALLLQFIQQTLENWAQRQQTQQQQLAELAENITNEHLRQQTATRLKAALTQANQHIQAGEQAIRVRELALTLLAGTGKAIANRFNQDLRAFVSSITPKFTENRYEYLQLDEQLNVKLFSPQKNDFLNFEEVSSGTQRQVALAVRIALAEALITANIRTPQFMILDEPFAFFDAARIQNALRILPHLSTCLQQIWVVAQEFAADAPITLAIHCDRSQQELHIG